MAQGKLVYAGWGDRLFAAFVDYVTWKAWGLVIGYAGIVAINNYHQDASLVGIVAKLLNLLVLVVYFVSGTAISGQTLGKKLAHIKVVRTDGEAPVGYGKAILRETLGKLISAIPLGLGFLWFLWDKKNQAWHDKIAGTVVVKV